MSNPMTLSPKELASSIDHTLLKTDASQTQVEKICDEAIAFGFAGVCVNLVHLPTVVGKLRGTGVKPVSVVGFPLGASGLASKVFETEEAIRQGAEEIDMVIHVGAMKAGKVDEVQAEIEAVVRAATPQTVKVILETSLLTQKEKITACKIAQRAGAAFVKTSTGFSTGGATLDDIALMREAVGDTMKIKASGGIRTRAQALAMISAGADRIGTSSGVEMMKEEGEEKT